MSLREGVLLLLALSAVAALVGLYLAPESVEAISEKWELSSHAAAESESFTHWDEDDPPLIPPRCAKCHSTLGFRDFLGEDGTTAGVVDESATTGTVVYCTVCHNPSSHAMTTVSFPSGVEIGKLGSEAVCTQCHQGLRSTRDVEQATAGLDADTVSEELSFINVHYGIAAATWLGTEVQGGYEYEGRSYVARFEHVPGVQACTECHDAHSLSVPAEACSPCHVSVANAADLRAIRTSEGDFDGDGDKDEGLYGEILTMQERVYPTLQTYAAQVAETRIVYAKRFPYFFVDTNGNGEGDADELAFNNQYGAWTPRLLRAAYNYHFSLQDQGSYTHNGLYVLQLLHDSLDDLGQRVSLEAGDLLRPASP